MSETTLYLNLFGGILYLILFVTLFSIIGKMADNIKKIRELLETGFNKNEQQK